MEMVGADPNLVNDIAGGVAEMAPATAGGVVGAMVADNPDVAAGVIDAAMTANPAAAGAVAGGVLAAVPDGEAAVGIMQEVAAANPMQLELLLVEWRKQPCRCR